MLLFENCSAFCEIAASLRMRPSADASSCALAWKLAKAELSRVSPNQIRHSTDDEDDEENQTHLKQAPWNATLFPTARGAATS
jgi:hypothetical protein